MSRNRINNQNVICGVLALLWLSGCSGGGGRIQYVTPREQARFCEELEHVASRQDYSDKPVGKLARVGEKVRAAGGNAMLLRQVKRGNTNHYAVVVALDCDWSAINEQRRQTGAPQESYPENYRHPQDKYLPKK